jgi:hypothetical protein
MSTNGSTATDLSGIAAVAGGTAGGDAITVRVGVGSARRLDTHSRLAANVAIPKAISEAATILRRFGDRARPNGTEKDGVGAARGVVVGARMAARAAVMSLENV